MQQEKEEFYKIVKETGELFVLFEGMTGSWEKDKDAFCKAYDLNIEELNNPDDEIEDYNEFKDPDF